MDAPDPRDTLGDLLVQCLDRLEDGAGLDQVVADVGAPYPELRGRLREGLLALQHSGLLDLADEEHGGFPAQLGDFRLLRRLGGGGMGVVYMAEQASMGRRVALKLVRPEQLYYPGARERFRREVDAIARMSHPNIVAVHAVGEEKGIPYYAMELVQGASLHTLLRGVQGRAPEDLTAEDMRTVLQTVLTSEGRDEALAWDESFWSGGWTDLCLTITRRVAEALEHAHGRGVLHRDVKPSNVMLTPEGRVLLVDFGLATVEGADRMTRTGSQVGSLPYMAPEQVEGRARDVDRRTDVYGLGVTLYELLTLQPAYLDRESTERTRARILEGRPSAPRRLVPRLSEDAQTVCLTAMERDPDRRYASAGALAGDLTNVLERRPIAARPAGTWLRARRWVARHRGAAAALGLAGAMTVLGPTGYALQQRRARHRIQEQLVRADANFQRTLDALELLVGVAVDDLEDVPMADGPRRSLLVAARDFFAQLVDDPAATPELRVQRARALVQLGRLHDELGEDEAAEVALREGAARLEEEGAARAGSPLAGELAGARHFLGGLLTSHAGDGEGVAVLESAVALLPRVEPEDLERTKARARLHSTLGTAYRRRGDVQLAQGAFRSILDDLGDVCDAEHDPDGDATMLVARTWSELAAFDATIADGEGRVAQVERAVALYRDLRARGRWDRPLRNELLIALSNLAGSVLYTRGDEARALLEEAVAIGEGLTEDFPGLPQYRSTLTGALTNLAGAHLLAGRLDEAQVLVTRALEHARRLVDDAPDVLDYRSRRMALLLHQATLDLRRDRPRDALARLDDAEADLTVVAAERPGDFSVRQTGPLLTYDRALAYVDLGDLAAARGYVPALVEAGRGPLLHGLAFELAQACAEGGVLAERREEAVALAVEALREGLRLGLPREALGSEGLSGLREEPEFQELLSGAAE